MKALWNIRGFALFIAILFMNATVDIAHKITIQNVLLKSFEGDTLIVLSALINAMILLPFILLFSPSGYISDRFAKTQVVRYAALSAVAITLLITLSYSQGWFYVSFALTFLLAVQSAIYSPAKYGLIKEIAGIDNLGAANGVVQAVTIVAILLSSMLFSVIFEQFYNGASEADLILPQMVAIGWILVLLSSVEALLAFRLPLTRAIQSTAAFKMRSYMDLSYLKQNMKRLRANENIWLSIVGLGIFWGVGQVVVAAFPAHYKAMTGDDNVIVIQAVLAVSAIGLVVGSIVAGRFSRLHIELGIVPVGALGLFAALLLFSGASHLYVMVVASVLFGFFGGLFIVPLNASIQYFADDKELGSILAGNNFIQNIVMVLFLLLAILFVQWGLSSSALFALSAFITLAGTVFAIKKLPHLFVRMLLLPILKTRYKLHVNGLHHLPQSGGVLLLGNHISWIDWLMIQIASPRAVKFVMEKSIYNQWYLRWFLEFFDVIPISGASGRDAINKIRERLDNGEVVALFPEGRISYNGQLGEFKKGFELALKQSSHPIVPFYLHGLWGSTFSRAQVRFKKMTREGVQRNIIVAFGAPIPASSSAETLKQKVVALSHETWNQEITQSQPLQYTWLRRAKSQRFKRAVVDATGYDMNNGKMITAVLLFSQRFRSLPQHNVGVILPASAIGSIVNMALFVCGKRPVNLNYTLSNDALRDAMRQAGIETVVTSTKFLKKLHAKGFDLLEINNKTCIRVEEVAKSFSHVGRVRALLHAYVLPTWMTQWCYFERCSMEETATILFSSGSEGRPKGIMLSHRNLRANIKQVGALLNFEESDVMLNSLPIFHSFGLTVTTLLPMCEGVTMVSAPDPTDAYAIGKLAARYEATIMFGTSTFLRLYTRNKKLHPLMFKSLRMVVAGAEKLKPEIKHAFFEKFGLEIFEGYGTTETSPVVSVNMPDALDLDSMRPVIGNKEGTVGQPIPGTVIKIVDPQTLDELNIGEDGLIMVGGPQVMKGYLNDAEKTAQAVVMQEGVRYYKTGDKGHVDGDGFITIVDRYSRFAKIGGEMISLGSVEEQLEGVFDASVACIALSLDDAKKGEKIVLLYEGQWSEEQMRHAVKQSKVLPLMQPSRYLHVNVLPRLASGKRDLNRAKEIAQEMCRADH